MPGPKTEEREIGRYTYRVTQLTAKPARQMLMRLINVIGPSFGAMFDGKASLTQILATDIGIGSGITQLTTRLTEDELEYVIGVLVREKTIAYHDSGKCPTLENQSSWDLHFTGELGEMFKVLAFSLEVNFKDFLGALKDIVPRKSQEEKEADGPRSGSQSQLTGSSGES